MAIGLGSLTAMLEEGNAKDWFQSPFIVTAAIGRGWHLCLGLARA